MLSAVSKCAPVAAEVNQSNVSSEPERNARHKGKAASLPDISGPWSLTGIGEIGAFTDADLTITQSGKTGKTITGSATFTGGSFTFTGKLRANGHMTGKATVQFGANTQTRQRFFADFTEDFLTFSGEVNLKSLDDLINIDGVKDA